MIYILLQLFLTLMNGYFAIDNYKNKRHEGAMFNSFVCGLCFMAFIYEIVKRS